jgi:heme-degrading monooxygenase HmoA
MSVLVTVRFPGDTDQFRSFVADDSNAGRLTEIVDDAKSRGAIHHRFAVGDGFVLVVDEWESGEQFQQFFAGNEKVEAVVRDSGGQGEPEITIAEAVDTPDQF